MLQLSHRGLGSGHPENSMAAFQAVVASKLDGIELDVRSCQTGEVFVLHDATLERTTNMRGKLQEHSAAELASCKLSDGSSLPLLEDVIKVAHKKLIDVELKDRESAAAVAERIAKNSEVDFLVTSKLPAALRRFRAIDQHTAVGYICSWRLWPPKRLVRELNAEYLVWNSRLVTGWGVRAAKKLNLAVMAYNVRQPIMATILDHHRIEGLIVDAPEPIDFTAAP